MGATNEGAQHMIQTHVFTSTAGAELRIEKHHLGQGIADYYRNVQLSAEGLSGGTFSLAYRVPGGTTWRTHVTDATESDVIVISGDVGPLAEALRVTFAGVGAGDVRVIINLSERGL